MMIATDTQTLNFIQHGSVIDHIPVRHALKLVRLLRLDEHTERVSMGMHLPSEKIGSKDMIKIEGWQLSHEEANRVAILAPEATISLINDYKVKDKFQVTLPETIDQILACPNLHCITNSEPCKTIFSVKRLRNRVLLECHHCRGLYGQDQINRYNT